MLKVDAKFSFAPGFVTKQDKHFAEAQKFIDSEVLRLSSPYVPLRIGTLDKSGILGTTVGSGLVVYNVPYADKQYHHTSDSRSYDAMRGGHWFERMIADHGKQLIADTKKVATGGLKQ